MRKVSASFCFFFFSRLLSLKLLFQMWLTHPSLTLSPPEKHRPAGPARHQRPVLKLFFFLLLFFLQPIIWIVLKSCDVIVKTTRMFLHLCPENIHCFTPSNKTYHCHHYDISRQIPVRACCVYIESFCDSCVISAFIAVMFPCLPRCLL